MPDLPKTVPAVICHAPEDYRPEEHPVPSPGPGEVASVGVDLKCYLGALDRFLDQIPDTFDYTVEVCERAFPYEIIRPEYASKSSSPT